MKPVMKRDAIFSLLAILAYIFEFYILDLSTSNTHEACPIL